MTNKEVNQYINGLKIAHYKKERPTVPLHAIPKDKFNCDTANGLTKAVMAAVAYMGGIADRRSSEGRFRPGTKYKTANGFIQAQGTWLPGQNKGIADIEVALPGRMIYIEIKIGKDRQSEVQKKFQRKVELAGAEYYIVKTFKDFITIV